MLLVSPVEVGDDLLSGDGPIGRLETDPELIHAGQVVDVVRGADSECLPAKLPGAAGAGAAIEEHEIVVRVKSEAPQIVGNRQPSLASADHDD